MDSNYIKQKNEQALPSKVEVVETVHPASYRENQSKR